MINLSSKTLKTQRNSCSNLRRVNYMLITFYELFARNSRRLVFDRATHNRPAKLKSI